MKGRAFLLCALLMIGFARGAIASDLATALAAGREGDWVAAQAASQDLSDVAKTIVTWQRLRNGRGSFDEYLLFLTERGDWPGLRPLRQQGERTISPTTPHDQVLDFFGNRHALTPHGALYLADALNGLGLRRQARAEIVLAWRNLPFSRSEQAIFQREFGSILAPHSFARMDRLLWRGQEDQVERMFAFLSPEERSLARARISLRSKGRGVDARIRAVDDSLSDDAGLAFERFLWRFDKGLASAETLILQRSESAVSLGNPQAWSTARRTLARKALREKRYKTAYELAANHHLISGTNFANLEWLAGYIALEQLEDPKTALSHFRRFRAGIQNPISIARGAYWEAAAYRALDRPDDAQIALEYAAEFQTGFYGQLAAEVTGLPMKPELIDTELEAYTGAEFLKDERVLAGILLAQAGEPTLAARFFAHVYERLDEDDQIKLGDLTLDLGEPHLSVITAKLAAQQGNILYRPYFPLYPLEPSNVPDEIVLSIMRRESEFNPRAQSRVGARGLMQLMPRTAEEVADGLGLDYDLDALTEDPIYNARLGADYLRLLREEFGDNILLIASAYNAGPGRTRQWIRQFGDPRRSRVDPLDWIESIPFRETRNYVMRVAESVVIYRARLAGEVQPIVLSDDIGGLPRN